MGACGSRPDGAVLLEDESDHERKQDLKVSCVLTTGGFHSSSSIVLYTITEEPQD